MSIECTPVLVRFIIFDRNHIVIGLAILLIQAISAAVQGPMDPQHSDPVWQATYWNNPTLFGPPVMHRVEPDLDFDWGSGSPDPVINTDRFSARWTRYIKVVPGTYRFTAVADDGLRLWVDNDLIINQWQDQAPTTYTVETYLGPGHHLLKVEYYENKGGAVAKVAWLRAAQLMPPSATTLSQPKTSPMMILEVVEQFAGDILSVAAAGDLAYMGLGTRVVMVDVSDPERSEIINRSEILSGTVTDITIKHPLAYVATGQGGLDILDLSEPASLKRITNVPVKGELDNLVISSNLLFGLGIQPGEGRGGPGFISVIDVSLPTHPVELAWHSLPYPAHQLAVDKDMLYVVGATGLHFFDASSPPTLPEISPPAQAKRKYRDVSVGNKYVYLAGEQLEVMPHPPSDKDTLVAAAKVNAPDLNVVLAHDSYVYTTSVFGGFQNCRGRLWVFDLTEEEIPELTTTEALPVGCVSSLAIANNRLFIGEGNALRVVDITDPEHPQTSGVLNLPGTITNLELFGDYLYGSGGLNNGLHIFDILQPPPPRLANTLDEVADWILQMEMLDERLYLSVFAGRIKTLDLSHPLDPETIDEFFWNERKTATLGAKHTYRVLPSGMLVFAGEEDNLWPTLLRMNDQTIDDKYLYLAGNRYDQQDHVIEHVSGVLYIVDAENRSELQQIEVIDLPMVANAATVLIENYLYIPTVSEGIMIFDARSPVNLKLIGNLPLDSLPTSVTREGRWLYITTDNAKLWVVDVSSPAAPQLVEPFDLPLTAHDIVVTKDYLYLAGGPGGILVLEKSSTRK